MTAAFAALSTEHKLLAVAAACLILLGLGLLALFIPALLSVGEERRDRTVPAEGVVTVPAVRRSPFARFAARNERIVREREARRG